MLFACGLNNGLVVGLLTESVFTVHEESEGKDKYEDEDVTENTCITLYLGIFRVTVIFD